MADYKAQIDRLRDWTVLDVQNRPALTIGMMRSAALTIEKLAVFDYICDGCRWWGVRPQRCSCCRRNTHMKDNYEVKE